MQIAQNIKESQTSETLQTESKDPKTEKSESVTADVLSNVTNPNFDPVKQVFPFSSSTLVFTKLVLKIPLGSKFLHILCIGLAFLGKIFPDVHHQHKSVSFNYAC